MDLHVDGVSAGHGELVNRWFSGNMRSLYWARLEATPWIASVVGEEGDSPKYFEGDDAYTAFLESLRTSPYMAQLVFCDEEERGRMGSIPAGVAPEYRVFSATLTSGEEDIADPAFCSHLVSCLTEAASGSNPTFGRIEYNQFSERTNLDIALRRKSRNFLPQGRTFLRGYAWVTICPEEIVTRLGGYSSLESARAFFQVIPLSGGGALLRATESLAEYSDDVMERVFSAVAKVLPPGTPRAHAAFPGLRFVNNDAGAASGGSAYR